MPVALGLMLPGAESAARLEQALEAEARGCESVWLEARPGESAFEELSLLARGTTRARVGVWGHALAARHPLVSAREIAELDRVSSGRAEIGLCDAGEAALAEAIGVCKRLWCDPSVEHRGVCFDLDETGLELRPVQRPWPRLHLAGESEAALERVARLGDGWLAIGHSPESIASPLSRLHAKRARAETHDGRFQVSARAEPRDRAELMQWQNAGVDRLIVSLEALRRLG